MVDQRSQFDELWIPIWQWMQSHKLSPKKKCRPTQILHEQTKTRTMTSPYLKRSLWRPLTCKLRSGHPTFPSHDFRAVSLPRDIYLPRSWADWSSGSNAAELPSPKSTTQNEWIQQLRSNVKCNVWLKLTRHVGTCQNHKLFSHKMQIHSIHTWDWTSSNFHSKHFNDGRN